MILGDNHMTLNRKKANLRGHYVSHEREFRGHLKKSRAKSPFFEGQGKPCVKAAFGDPHSLAITEHPSLMIL